MINNSRNLFHVKKISQRRLHIVTPILKYGQDNHKSNIFLKMECFQPSSSFKDRGIGYMIHDINSKNKISRLITSSGGNAGLSVAYHARVLKIPVSVFVPTTTNAVMIEKIKATGADVTVTGNNWNEADEYAKIELRSNQDNYYIPPFNDPRIWEGHSSIVDELVNTGIRPDNIILSVGGGGLLRGIQIGLERHNLLDTRIIAVETEGAASFAAAKKANQVVRLDKINTIASTLGALSGILFLSAVFIANESLHLSVIPECLASAVRTVPHVVSDREAVHACVRFSEDLKVLVEPACGASLSILYNRDVLKNFGIEKADSVTVFVVCGGSMCTLDILSNWKNSFGIV